MFSFLSVQFIYITCNPFYFKLNRARESIHNSIVKHSTFFPVLRFAINILSRLSFFFLLHKLLRQKKNQFGLIPLFFGSTSFTWMKNSVNELTSLLFICNYVKTRLTRHSVHRRVERERKKILWTEQTVNTVCTINSYCGILWLETEKRAFWFGGTKSRDLFRDTVWG